MSQTDAKIPVFVSTALVAVGLLLGFLTGSVGGYFAGGVLAGIGAAPAMWGMWRGVQGESQGPLAMSLGMVFVSLGAALLMVVLAVVKLVS